MSAQGTTPKPSKHKRMPSPYLPPDVPGRDEYEDHLAQFKAALPKE